MNPNSDNLVVPLGLVAAEIGRDADELAVQLGDAVTIGATPTSRAAIGSGCVAARCTDRIQRAQHRRALGRALMPTPLIIRSRGDAQIKLAVDPQHPNRIRAILTLSDEVIGRPIIVELAADELRNVLGDALRLISADKREVDQWWMQLRDKPRPEPALPEAAIPEPASR
jgi:hypothetical protein